MFGGESLFNIHQPDRLEGTERASAQQVEFNKAALSLADSLGEELRKVALNRLLKVRRTAPPCSQHNLVVLRGVEALACRVWKGSAD